MKRIILSLVIITAVVAVGVGATYAWFTSSDTANNSLASGKMKVELRGPDQAGAVIALDTTQSFKGGLAPGVPTRRYEMQVYNKGWGESTLPVKYSWTDGFTGGDSDLYNKLNVKVEDGNCDWLTNWPAGVTVKYDGPLSSMDRVVMPTVLDPNITRCTWFTFELAESAGNDLQGKTAQFNLVLDATQPENPGWTE